MEGKKDLTGREKGRKEGEKEEKRRRKEEKKLKNNKMAVLYIA